MPSLSATDEFVTLVLTYANEVWNQGAISRLDGIFSDTLIYNNTSIIDLERADKYKEFIAIARAAFPGLTYDVDEIAFNENRIELHWSATGEDQPEAQAAISGQTTLQITDGEITEMWASVDP